MRSILPQNLIKLAQNCPAPLYVVGGSVRDFLAGLSAKGGSDFDLCSAMDGELFAKAAQKSGFSITATYKNTGTVKLSDKQTNAEYEYTRFRSDKYVRGVHTPVETCFTDDIKLDAKRRDFTANAVYYDVQKDDFVDPLQGIPAIKEKRLTTVAPATKVFGEDGLRLMRLARQSAQLGFTPDDDCFNGATQNAALIRDISPERIFAELSAILTADEKYGNIGGVYTGLSLLDKTRVLDEIIPELTLGRDMRQRPDFHKYDVLEHSLRACAYAKKEIRLAALLHDVGKPLCFLRDGNTHAHPDEGATIASEILRRLKAPTRTIEKTKKLIALHMYDFDCKTGENKLRRFFAENYAILDDLLSLKQADYSACMDDFSPAPTVIKWQTLLDRLKAERAPLSLKELAVNGKDLLNADLPAPLLGKLLHKLLLHCVCNPQDNEKTRLLKLAKGFIGGI